jgi:hypothetical protein
MKTAEERFEQKPKPVRLRDLLTARNLFTL